MAWFDDKQLVNILTIASILSAAGFGALGLFTDFKKDGKVTRYGRMAVGGIMLSAAFSIGVGLLQGRIEAKRSQAAATKEAADRDREGRNFAAQINRLEGLNRNLFDVNRAASDLQQGMRNSLRSQGLLLTNARSSMLLTASVGAQQQENAARVLRTMWEDFNRIDGSRIALSVMYDCSSTSGQIPRILPAGTGTEAVIRVAPRGRAAAQGIPPTSFAVQPLLPGLTLRAMDQRTEVFRVGGSHSTQIHQYSSFGPFFVDDMEEFTSPEAWANAEIEILIAGLQPGLADALEAVRDSNTIGAESDKSYLALQYHLTDDQRRNPYFVVRVLPCGAYLRLAINGRTVAVRWAAVVQVRENPGDDRGLIVVKSFIEPTDSRAFPSFSATPGANPPARR